MSDGQEFRDNPSANRYELPVGEHLAFVQYHDKPGGVRVLLHTEVPAALEGQGIGGRIVRAALEDAKAHHRLVVPACPFVSSYIERHPEYKALIAPKD